MKDREILEMAAKAYANDAVRESPFGFYRVIGCNEEMQCDVMVQWNPLTDDGDALRLAVKLNIHVRVWVYACEAQYGDCESTGLIHASDCGGDVCAATRRAITRAAAQIGKEMK